MSVIYNEVIVFKQMIGAVGDHLVDLHIVDHKEQSCLELVAFNLSTNFEAPHVYVDSQMLKAKLTYLGNLSTTDDFLPEITSEGNPESFNLIRYITSRIEVSQSGDKNNFKLRLVPKMFEDTCVIWEDCSSNLDIVLETKPNNLIRFVYHHKKKLT
jgi:hypothetical protein